MCDNNHPNINFNRGNKRYKDSGVGLGESNNTDTNMEQRNESEILQTNLERTIENILEKKMDKMLEEQRKILSHNYLELNKNMEIMFQSIKNGLSDEIS